jgi:hypothetical protein
MTHGRKRNYSGIFMQKETLKKITQPLILTPWNIPTVIFLALLKYVFTFRDGDARTIIFFVTKQQIDI